MQRITSMVLGAIMLALSVIWFFTASIDGIVTRLAGYGEAFDVSPISKMMLADPLSQLFAGLFVMGLLLLALGSVPAADRRSGDDQIPSRR